MKALVLNFAVLFLLVSCQQEEFFEKDLSAIGAPSVPDVPGTIVDGGETGPEIPEVPENLDDDKEVIPSIPLEPAKPVVVAKKDCGSLKHGETEERVRFENATVAFGNTCKSEKQTRTCDDGKLSDWTGSFNAVACEVAAPRDCGNVKHGQTITRTRYKAQTVAFAGKCESEVQTATCHNGTLSDWSGSYGFDKCEIAAAANCGNVKHGETATRVRYEAASVPFGQSCKSEVQKAVCDNGKLSNFTGAYAFDSCNVESQKVKRVTEKFTQNSKGENKVDILWVIDDSGSMSDDQAALARNFNVFIKDFLKEDIDFRMGITTTDNTKNKSGQSKCDLNLLTSEQARLDQEKFVNNFKKCIKVGTDGDWQESGFATSLNYIKKHGKDLLRKDAQLVTIFVSDEEEQSQIDPHKYVDQVLLAAGKGDNRGLFKAYAIEETHAKDYNKKVSERKHNWWEIFYQGLPENIVYYKDAANLTGGKVADIGVNFATTLQNMGEAIVKLAQSFKLNRLPYDKEIVVTVDGEIVTTGWEIDVESGALKFADDATPRVGAEITITYNALIE